jgi:hypothetical protein
MTKDDILVSIMLIGLFLVFCFAPDLYNPTFQQ